MNIRPRNIKKYDGGGYFDNLNNDYFNWYNGIWKENARILGNLPLSKRTDRWGKPTGYDIHHQTDDLRGAAWSNYNYTLASNKDNIRNDILYYLDNSGVNYTSPEDFVSKYNSNIDNIFNTQNKLYNYSMKDTSWTPFNRNYNLTYHSKGTGKGYSTILYDPTSELYRGTSTHARRPDLYEKDFDKLTDDEKWDRIHKIKLNGKDIYVAKESNGHLRLLPNITTEEDIKLDPAVVKDPEKEKEGSITPEERADPESFWSKLGAGLKNVAPDLLDTLRLAGNMINNQRVYNESMKAIKPNLLQSYHTYRQVVGDEATKLAYYRRAVQGEQKAARPFTSDADRQVAYMNEAKRIGDELRAQGDLADNQRIRETSAESAAHLDSNRERNTAVANSNLTEMLKADAAKHQLTALKYSADWTNLEQYLMGRLYKLEKEKAKKENIEEQIKTLQMLDDIANDPDIKAAYSVLNAKAKNLFPNGNIDWNDPRLSEDIKNLLSVRRKAMIKYYTLYGKQGTKLERKQKDDSLRYLYKTSRDIVEHFRKMSKMTDDSRVRTMPKPIKLPSHPKKFLYGGVAPFTIYRPLGVGGESSYAQSTTNSSGSGKSEKDNAAKDKLDMIKELFKAIQGQGLPVDVSMAYKEISNVLNKAKAFGEELSTDDIASMYLKSMDTISRLKHSKEVYDKAQAVATLKESLDEFAVDALGNYVVQDEDNNITTVKSLEEIKEQGLNPITNLLLLNLRAYSPNLALQQGDYFINNIINNGMGINKIGAQIKALAGDIGTSETKLDGLTLIESNKVKSGLQVLANAPDGYYKVTTETKSLEELVKAALSYIENMLSPSLKAILNIHGGVKENIAKFLSSQMDASITRTVQPVAGTKPGSKSSGSNEDDKGDSKNSAALMFALGLGPRVPVVFNTGTSYLITANGILGLLQTTSGENLGLGATLLDASKSQEAYFLWNKATFGGSRIIPTAFNHVILNDSTIIGVDLPYKKGLDGNEVPDFLLLRRMEEADLEIRLKGIKSDDIESINKIYLSHQLPPKYDLNGKLIKKDYKRYAVIQVTLDENSLLNKEAILSDEVTIADSDIERDLYNEAMRKITGNKDFELDSGWFSSTKLYKGSIFVPYSEDLAFAALSSGKPFNVDLPNNSSKVQVMQYAPATLTYNPPSVPLSYITNN